ncbi:680_t:CDS:2, partial [Funneliformis geosporum]
MSNDQLTINTLRELNSRLASEITELRKENAEIPELRKKFSEVEAENNELKAENNNFIVKLDDDAKGIDQSSVNTISIKMKNSNDTPVSNISDNISNVAPERIENSSNNTPDEVKHLTSGSSDIYQEKDSRSFTSLIHISSEEKEINEFMELQEKERVSNMARERNREKKICRGRQIVQKTSSSSDTQNVSIPIAPIPLAHDSVPEGPSNSSDNSKEEAWFDEDMFFNEANPSKVNTVTSDDDVYFGEANEVNKHD